MNVTKDTILDKDELPTFGLDCRYDDPVDPNEVTVFAPEVGDITSAWITAAAGHTIPLDHVA